MIVKTLYFEIAEQQMLSVMPEKNFTKPVYQKIRQTIALNLNGNFIHGTDGFRVRNSLGQRPRGVFKHLLRRRAERFKPNIGRVLENAEAGHKVADQPAGETSLVPSSARPRPLSKSSPQISIIPDGEPDYPPIWLAFGLKFSRPAPARL